jgi:hypothetical protein
VALANACLAWPALRATWWVPALLGYGAVILSFVGALHWGFAMTLPDMPLRQRHACFACGRLCQRHRAGSEQTRANV